MQNVETPISRFRLRDDGLLDVRAINPDVRRTAELIRDDVDTMVELVRGVPVPTLWQPIETAEKIPPEAFQTFIANMSRVVSALAIVVDRSTGRVLGGFPDAVGSLMLPVRTFSDESEALEWLESFLAT